MSRVNWSLAQDITDPSILLDYVEFVVLRHMYLYIGTDSLSEQEQGRMYELLGRVTEWRKDNIPKSSPIDLL